MKKLFLSLIVIPGILFAATSAMAVGVGVYGDFSRGFDDYGGNLGGNFKVFYDYLGASGGLIIDTAAANNSLLNYRLRLGGGKISFNKKKFSDISMVHTFGISPTGMNGKYVRFWFGPRIGLHYQFGSYTRYAPSSDPFMIELMMFGRSSAMLPVLMMNSRSKTSLEFFRGDIGLVFAGFNFNFGDHITLSIELGFDYGFKIGKVKSSGMVPGDAYGEGFEGFGAISFMYRINDTHAAPEGS